VPPITHRTNLAERATRTWKHHFEAALAVAEPTFPLVKSPALSHTVNLMRTSRIAPDASSWKILHGKLDFVCTLLDIPVSMPSAPPLQAVDAATQDLAAAISRLRSLRTTAAAS